MNNRVHILRSLVAVLVLLATIGSPITIVRAEDCSNCEDFPEEPIYGSPFIWAWICNGTYCIAIDPFDPDDPILL